MPKTREVNLREIKLAAKNSFAGIAGIEGFGIGSGSLRVYVVDEGVREKLPATFRGVPLELVVTGVIAAQ